MGQETGAASEQTGSRERLVAELCARRGQFVVIFAFALVFLLLSLPYLFVVDSDSAMYAVAVLNLAGSLAFALGSGSVLWVCTRRN